MNKKFLYVLIVSLIIMAFFLVFEHRVHLYGFVPYALFVIFIGLHFFMHAGHGGHGEQKKGDHHHHE